MIISAIPLLSDTRHALGRLVLIIIIRDRFLATVESEARHMGTIHTIHVYTVVPTSHARTSVLAETDLAAA